MPKFKKKPVEIEARQLEPSFDGRAAFDIAVWCGGRVGGTFEQPHIIIQTLEGEMRADTWDWIIEGVSGEYYPCKPEIFELTYEAV